MLRLLGLIGLLSPMFGGFDPVTGKPWYHEKLTWGAAELAGWSTGAGDEDDSTAAAALAWHADYVDSYLYNPLWWAAGGLSRFRSSLVHHDDLVKLHFDDLNSVQQIALMWNRYRGGVVAGLLWAAERGDVGAARNIVGTGLHAMQDFYSHSNWVDDPGRRQRTWSASGPTSASGADPRLSLHLYTGAYEKPAAQAFKPHGVYAFDCAIMRRLLPKNLMDVMCAGISPLSNTSMCQRWRECQGAAPPRPQTIAGVTVPPDVLYVLPPGIALDSPWLSEIGVQNRDLPDRGTVKASDLFDTALRLAGAESRAWLEQLERIMGQAGLAGFWQRVRTEPRTGLRRPPGPPELADMLSGYDGDLVQYEEPARTPFAFLTAGAYPPDPTGVDEGWFLRLDLTTATDALSGTDADISAIVDGVSFPLDRMHGRHPGGGAGDWRLLEHNDFEAGATDSYVVGPLAARPQRLALRNVSATGGQIVQAAWSDLTVAVGIAVDAITDFLLGIVAGQADFVGTDKAVWSWDDLVRISTAGRTGFTLRIRGGDEGQHDLRGDIRATATADGLSVTVRLTSLFAVKESTWDRGTTDDEPFVVGLVSSPAANVTVPWLSPELTGVDTGETRALSLTATVPVPRYGGLIVPVQVWESDDEGVAGQRRIRDDFVRGYDQRTVPPRSSLIDAIGRAVAPDWKLASVDAFAFLRGPTTGVAHVVNRRSIQRWVPGNSSIDLPLDAVPTRWVTIGTLPALAAPVLQAPGDGEHFARFPRTTRLQWLPVDGAGAYRVEVEYASVSAGQQLWSAQLARETTDTRLEFDFVGDQPGRWRVWALAGPGGTPSQPSSWRGFDYSPRAALAVPVLTEPADGQHFTHFPRVTTVRWTPVPGATGYRVDVEFGFPVGGQISWSPLLSQAVDRTECTLDFVGDQPGRWRVTALDASGGHRESGPSDWRQFDYRTSPAGVLLATPVPVAPADGEPFSHFPRTTTLRWSPVDGATDYDVTVEFGGQPEPTPWAPWLIRTVQVPSLVFDFVGAQPGRWRVVARDATGARLPSTASAWSQFVYRI